MIQGTFTWNDAGNNQAYVAGHISMTFNGVSIYFVCKNSPDPKLQEIAADANHQHVPRGLSKQQPGIRAGRQRHAVQAQQVSECREGIPALHDGKEQYGPWLANCLGYWSNPLKAYSKMSFWTPIRN